MSFTVVVETIEGRVLLQVEKVAKASGDLKCYIFVFEDAVVHISRCKNLIMTPPVFADDRKCDDYVNIVILMCTTFARIPGKIKSSFLDAVGITSCHRCLYTRYFYDLPLFHYLILYSIYIATVS